MNRFRLIKGGKNPSIERRSDECPLEVLACPVCDGTTMIPAKSSMVIDKDENIEGGVDVVICATCMSEGRLTEIG